MITIKLKKVEEGIVPIYENESKEKLINARQLHEELNNKRQFADWIKQRIERYKFVENEDFITFHNFVKRGNTKKGKKGEIKEKGYKIEEICYKVSETKY